MKHLNLTKTLLAFGAASLSFSVLTAPVLAFVPPVMISEPMDFELQTADTAALTTFTASAGGQVTQIDVQTNYMDITLDNSSVVTTTVSAPGRYFKITKQSGSDAYTVTPSCPTTAVTLKGTGAQTVLRLQILTTTSCGPTPLPTPPVDQGGGGGVTPVAPTALAAGGIGETPLSFLINNGAKETNSLTLTLTFNADPRTVKGYAASLDSSLKNAGIWPLSSNSFDLPAVPGTYTVYLRYYSITGDPSALLTQTITLAPGGAYIPSPPGGGGTPQIPVIVTNMINPLGLESNVSQDDAVLKQVYADAKEFGLTLTADQALAIRNFIVYGISPATIKFGSGERRAISRDYMDTVRRSEYVWSDIERLATGQIPIVRNLELERQRVSIALPVFRDIFGHDPNFKIAKENLAWNTLLYRIRFPRDMAKEQAGLNAYYSLYRHYPRTPFGWSVVRVLGYVR